MSSTRAVAPPRLLALLVLALALLSASVLAAAPAQARVWSTTDDTQGGWGDLVRVQVSAGEKVVRVRARFSGHLPYETSWLFDTDSDDPGAEFGATRNSDSGPGTIYVYRVERWETGIINPRCAARTARVRDGGRLLKASFALGCLATDEVKPDRLRVNVISADDGAYYDHAPAKFRFGRWFLVG